MKVKIGLVILLLGGGLMFTAESAEVPTVMTVQGFLTNSEGAAVPNAEYSAVFSIYNVDAGGAPLWTETRMIGTVDGVFSIIIGTNSAIPGDLFGSTSLFLGIAIEGEPELAPRQRLVTAPYAFRALNADTAAYALAGVGGATVWADDGTRIRLQDQSDSVGIGINQPLYKLHVAGQAISGINSDASGANSTISGGGNNTATGERSVISGGQLNTAGGSQSTIGGGYSNIANAQEATIAGGQKNIASGAQSTVGGGEFNTASGWRSTVGGGYLDTAGGEYSVVAGGEGSTAAGDWSVIAGGMGNYTESEYAVVGGGNSNFAFAQNSTVSGGGGNQADGYGATIPGGIYNIALGDYSFAGGIRAWAGDEGCFIWSDASDVVNTFSSVTANEFAVRATGGVRFVTSSPPTLAGVEVAAGGGSWSSMSDRNAKENFEEIDLAHVLEKLDALPVTTWNYKSQDEVIRHIGPMAQDFYAAFGVGEDDKHITAIDADGVALAAIKALYAKQRKLDSQEREIAKLTEDVARLNLLVQQLLNQQAGN